MTFLTRWPARVATVFAFVLLPFSALAQNLAERLSAAGPFSEVAALIEASDGAQEALGAAGDLTLFAPTDEAFRRLPDDLRGRIDAASAAREMLLGALLVRGVQEQDNLPVEMETVGGQRLVVTYTDGQLTLRLAAPERSADPDSVRLARVSAAQIRSRNSVRAGRLLVHAIDRVLLPEGLIAALETQQPSGLGFADASAEMSAAEQIARSDEGTTRQTVPIRQPGEDDPAPRVGQESTPDAEVIVLTPADRVDPAETSQPDAAQASAAGAPSEAEAVDGGSDPPAAIDLTREVTSVADLLGAPVRGTDGEEVGEVADLLMALDDGRVQTLVIARSSGFLGLGDAETVRVPLDGVSIDPLEGTLIVSQPVGADAAE